jgi:pimeloyl-ACP methyl ester carboxylesterase
VLLVWGENDGLVPPVFGEAYRELIPSSRLVVIPAVGHAPFEERPDEFLEAFTDMLAEQGFGPGVVAGA